MPLWQAGGSSDVFCTKTPSFGQLSLSQDQQIGYRFPHVPDLAIIIARRQRRTPYALGGPLRKLHLSRAFGLGTNRVRRRSEEHTSELQSLMRISYAVFCLNKKKTLKISHT